MRHGTENGLTSKTAFCFWLVPAEPLRQQLISIVRQLASDWDACEFGPHVTIYYGPSDENEARKIARQMAREFGPFELTATGLDHSGLFTKTLFIEFADSPELRRMSDTIQARCACPAAYELNPHLSLLYKKMRDTDRTALCRSLIVPKGICLFDTLSVVAMEMPFDDPKQANGWRTIFEGKLCA